MVYLITDQDTADKIGRELYKLSRPNPDPRDVTTHQFGYITHPTDSRIALAMDLESDIPLAGITPRDLKNLNGLLNKITPGGSSKLKNNVESKSQGTRVKVKAKDILPDFPFLTYEQMDADGWFITDEN